jgi:hypothetical protein
MLPDTIVTALVTKMRSRKSSWTFFYRKKYSYSTLMGAKFYNKNKIIARAA